MHFQRGSYYLEQGRTTQAILDFDKALNLKGLSSDPAIYNSLGIAHHNLDYHASGSGLL